MNTHVFNALPESGLDMSHDLRENPLGGMLVLEVQGRSVDEGKTEVVLSATSIRINVDVDRGRPYKRGVAAAPLNELGNGRQLLFGGGLGYDTGIEEEPKE